MTNNLNAFGAQGMRYAFWGLWDSVAPSYITGTDDTMANAADSGMGRMLGIADLSISVPESPIIGRPGDNALLGSFIANPSDGPSGSMAFGSFDQLLDVAATQRAINAEGPHDISIDSNQCYEYLPLFLVVNSPAMSDASGSLGEAGWQVEEYFYVFAQPLSVQAKTLNAAHSYTHRLIFNERGILPYGETIIAGNYGLTQGWKTSPYWSARPIYYHTYIGDGGAAQTFTLDNPPYIDDGDALQIWEAGTKLTHTTNYSASITTGLVTFVGTDPAAAAFAVCKVMFEPTC